MTEQHIVVYENVDWFGEQLLLNPDGTDADLSGFEFQLQVKDKAGTYINKGTVTVDGSITNKLVYQIPASLVASMDNGAVQRYFLIMRPTDTSWLALIQTGLIQKKNGSDTWQS
jgi:hypothetical protein